jgi:hypothetical protein
MEETLQDVDELASHYSLEEVYVDEAKVLRIGAQTIIYRASGSVNVILQWGSNSDLRHGDGAELFETFPATCDITVAIDDPWDLSGAETRYGVDTSTWREAMAPEQEWRALPARLYGRVDRRALEDDFEDTCRISSERKARST